MLLRFIFLILVSERTLEQATEEYEKLKLELNNLRKNLSTDQRNLSLYNDRVNKLRERKTDLTAQQLKVLPRTIERSRVSIYLI